MSEGVEMHLGGARLVPDPSGVLWWPERSTLIVADLHLEKGASFARTGSLLPPYDTRATLARLAERIEALRPRLVVALGDSFHRVDAAHFLDAADARLLDDLTRRQDWVWVAGNHDPLPPAGLGGRVEREALQLGSLALRHEAVEQAGDGELSGHYHPKARISIHGRSASYRCFVADDARLVLPAFGAYAGGLDVSAPAFARLFPTGFTAHLIGRHKILSLSHRLLVGEPLPA